MVLLDLTSKGINGQQAEDALAAANITSNKNPVPFDNPRPADWVGLRLGVSAATTRGLAEADMRTLGQCIADLIDAAAQGRVERAVVAAKSKVAEICSANPIYPA